MSDVMSAAEGFQRADDRWHAELIARFGRDAAQARYEPRGRGEAFSPLRVAYHRRQGALRRWQQAQDAAARTRGR